MILRKCVSCGVEANTEEELKSFVKSKKNKYKRRNECKPCRSKEASKWVSKNKERHRKNMRKVDAKRRVNGKHAAVQAKRRAVKLKASPSWANQDKIKIQYTFAKFLSQLNPFGGGYHVDHVVPLTSDKVCGLHCEDNLRVINAFDNLSKGNNFEQLQFTG